MVLILSTDLTIQFVKPDIGGLGAQFRRQQAEADRAQQRQPAAAKAKPPATPFGWRPTLDRGQASGSQKPPGPERPPTSTATASADPVLHNILQKNINQGDLRDLDHHLFLHEDELLKRVRQSRPLC